MRSSFFSLKACFIYLFDLLGMPTTSRPSTSWQAVLSAYSGNKKRELSRGRSVEYDRNPPLSTLSITFYQHFSWKSRSLLSKIKAQVVCRMLVFHFWRFLPVCGSPSWKCAGSTSVTWRVSIEPHPLPCILPCRLCVLQFHYSFFDSKVCFIN